MCGWQVKLCDPIVTQEPHLSALEIKRLYIKLCINSFVYFTLLYTHRNITQNKIMECVRITHKTADAK